MLPKTRWFHIVTLIGLLTFFGCSDDDPNPTATKKILDAISIKSVTPSSGVTPDIARDFTVIVEFELASVDSGAVMVGFNTNEAGRYAMVSDATTLVIKGSGEHQFNVTSIPREWGDDVDFKVYVNLSEHPRGPSWSPLATDIRVITLN
jgi:hypothetical protein